MPNVAASRRIYARTRLKLSDEDKAIHAAGNDVDSAERHRGKAFFAKAVRNFTEAVHETNVVANAIGTIGVVKEEHRLEKLVQLEVEFEDLWEQLVAQKGWAEPKSQELRQDRTLEELQRRLSCLGHQIADLNHADDGANKSLLQASQLMGKMDIGALRSAHDLFLPHKQKEPEERHSIAGSRPDRGNLGREKRKEKRKEKREKREAGATKPRIVRKLNVFPMKKSTSNLGRLGDPSATKEEAGEAAQEDFASNHGQSRRTLDQSKRVLVTTKATEFDLSTSNQALVKMESKLDSDEREYQSKRGFIEMAAEEIEQEHYSDERECKSTLKIEVQPPYKGDDQSGSIARITLDLFQDVVPAAKARKRASKRSKSVARQPRKDEKHLDFGFIQDVVSAVKVCEQASKRSMFKAQPPSKDEKHLELQRQNTTSSCSHELLRLDDDVLPFRYSTKKSYRHQHSRRLYFGGHESASDINVQPPSKAANRPGPRGEYSPQFDGWSPVREYSPQFDGWSPVKLVASKRLCLSRQDDVAYSMDDDGGGDDNNDDDGDDGVGLPIRARMDFHGPSPMEHLASNLFCSSRQDDVADSVATGRLSPRSDDVMDLSESEYSYESETEGSDHEGDTKREIATHYWAPRAATTRREFEAATTGKLGVKPATGPLPTAFRSDRDGKKDMPHIAKKVRKLRSTALVELETPNKGGNVYGLEQVLSFRVRRGLRVRTVDDHMQDQFKHTMQNMSPLPCFCGRCFGLDMSPLHCFCGHV